MRRVLADAPDGLHRVGFYDAAAGAFPVSRAAAFPARVAGTCFFEHVTGGLLVFPARLQRKLPVVDVSLILAAVLPALLAAVRAGRQGQHRQ